MALFCFGWFNNFTVTINVSSKYFRFKVCFVKSVIKWSCFSPHVFVALSICRLRKFASVFEIVSNKAVFSYSFFIGFLKSLLIHAALTQPEHLILVKWMGLETRRYDNRWITFYLHERGLYESLGWFSASCKDSQVNNWRFNHANHLFGSTVCTVIICLTFPSLLLLRVKGPVCDVYSLLAQFWSTHKKPVSIA